VEHEDRTDGTEMKSWDGCVRFLVV